MDEEEWRSRLVQAVAQQVRRYRLERGLSVQKLADICTEQYGLPIKRSVLANFEGGRRPALSVVELLVLARILEVPPAQLLFPVGREDLTEVLPGTPMDTWAALKWFTGEDDQIPGTPEKQDAEPLRLYREHERYVAEWRAQRRKIEQILGTRHLTEFRAEPDPEALDSHLVRLGAETMGRIADALTAVRSEMRNSGLKPPALEPDLAHIETGGSPVSAAEGSLSLASIPMEPLPSEEGEAARSQQVKKPKGDQS